MTHDQSAEFGLRTMIRNQPMEFDNRFIFADWLTEQGRLDEADRIQKQIAFLETDSADPKKIADVLATLSEPEVFFAGLPSSIHVGEIAHLPEGSSQSVAFELQQYRLKRKDFEHYLLGGILAPYIDSTLAFTGSESKWTNATRLDSNYADLAIDCFPRLQTLHITASESLPKLNRDYKNIRAIQIDCEIQWIDDVVSFCEKFPYLSSLTLVNVTQFPRRLNSLKNLEYLEVVVRLPSEMSIRDVKLERLRGAKITLPDHFDEIRQITRFIANHPKLESLTIDAHSNSWSLNQIDARAEAINGLENLRFMKGTNHSIAIEQVRLPRLTEVVIARLESTLTTIDMMRQNNPQLEHLSFLAGVHERMPECLADLSSVRLPLSTRINSHLHKAKIPPNLSIHCIDKNTLPDFSKLEGVLNLQVDCPASLNERVISEAQNIQSLRTIELTQDWRHSNESHPRVAEVRGTMLCPQDKLFQLPDWMPFSKVPFEWPETKTDQL